MGPEKSLGQRRDFVLHWSKAIPVRDRGLQTALLRSTIFTIYLPLVVTPSSHTELPPAQVLPQGHRECVLRVEDDALLGALTAAITAHLGPAA